MKRALIGTGLALCALLIGCSKDDGDVSSSSGSASESVPAGEAMSELCEVVCDTMADCLDMDRSECEAGCGSTDDDSSDDCSTTRRQVDACSAALSDLTCDDFESLPPDSGLEPILPDECASICDSQGGDGDGDGGPLREIDVASSLSYCQGYANPPCSDESSCDGGYCGSCSALVEACDDNEGECDSSSDGYTVECELLWVDCMYDMNCGDMDAGERAAQCKEDFDACKARG